jgi:hypothetical protein
MASDASVSNDAAPGLSRVAKKTAAPMTTAPTARSGPGLEFDEGAGTKGIGAASASSSAGTPLSPGSAARAGLNL